MTWLPLNLPFLRVFLRSCSWINCWEFLAAVSFLVQNKISFISFLSSKFVWVGSLREKSWSHTTYMLNLSCSECFNVECHGRAVECIGCVFWWLSRQNPGFESRLRPWCLCPWWAGHFAIIASLHPGVKWVPVRAELVVVWLALYMRRNGSNWAVYSPGSWGGFRNDLCAWWAGVIM